MMSDSDLVIKFAIPIDTGKVWHCQCPIYETKTISFFITAEKLLDIQVRNKSVEQIILEFKQRLIKLIIIVDVDNALIYSVLVLINRIHASCWEYRSNNEILTIYCLWCGIGLCGHIKDLLMKHSYVLFKLSCNSDITTLNDRISPCMLK